MRQLPRLFLGMAFAFILSVSTARAAANQSVGIGVQYSWVYNYVNGPGLTVKIGNFPVIGANLNIGNGGLGLGLTVDWHAWNPPLGPFLFYLGPGIGGNIFIGSSFSFNLGLRLPIGLQWFPAKWLEIFLETPPTVGLSLGTGAGYGSGSSGSLTIPTFGIGVSLGVRFYFL